MKTIKAAENSANQKLETNTSEQIRTTLNFKSLTTMKRQILLLIVALFAVTTAFGQWTPAPLTVKPLTGCINDPLHPLAGQEYAYKVSVAAPYTATTGYEWFVTQDQTNLLTPAAIINPTTDGIIAMGTTGAYNDPTTGINQIDLTWSSKALSSTDPYFLVVKYRATNTDAAVNCEAMNMKVYKIIPLSSFTLDIAAIFDPTDGDNTLASTVTFETCSPDIVSAVYNATNDEMDYDFGSKYLYVKVLAANFNEEWTPTIQINGLSTGQTVTEVLYSSDPANFVSTNSITVAETGVGTNIYGGTGSAIAAVNPDDTSAGEAVYFRIEITNGDYEGKVDSNITFAIDGVDKLTNPDLADTDCTDQELEDQVTQTILARPVITDDIPDTPNPTDFIPQVQP